VEVEWNVEAVHSSLEISEKLRLDLAGILILCIATCTGEPLMDHDSLDLIARLCTRAGMIMEDISVLALASPPADPQALTLSLAELSEAAEDIGALITAAKSVVRDAGRES
jgi:hypothetical protein